MLNKNINVKIDSLPELATKTDLDSPISPKESLFFDLSQPDETFAYKLIINEVVQDCTTKDIEVSCPLHNYKLKQGEQYDFIITQNFEGAAKDIVTDAITLRDPIEFTGSSVVNEQIIYDKPDRISITTNKELSDAGSVILKSGDKTVGTNSEITETGIDVVFKSELPREKDYTLSINGSKATDGAYLPEEYALSFKTSGGPKITSVNFGYYDVSPSKNFVLNFDSALSSKQDLSKFITISTASGVLPANISVSGTQIFIDTSQAIDRCIRFTVTIADDIANVHGVTGGSYWSRNSRTTCKQVFSVGTSVQGRDLAAYRFGSGPNKILFVGGMHGNERSSYRTLIAWVDELEQKYSNIPSDKTVIVIPDINPDGYARQTRTNTNSIDLNRNFPSNDWSTAIHMPGGIFLENGGGNTPLDQPESSALASYINTIGPRIVLTYHAVARTVISNGASDSHSLASSYSLYSGFAHYTSAHEDGIFAYPTTGEFETWLADKKSIPTLLVELATMSSNELYSQRSAMWAMLGI